MEDNQADLDGAPAGNESGNGGTATRTMATAAGATAETASLATAMQASRFMTAEATIELMDEDIIADAQEESDIPADGDSDDEHPDIDALTDSVHKRCLVSHEESCIDLVDTDGHAVPLSMNLPGPPPGWIPKPRQAEKGEPAFADVDNPGLWPEFVFRPAFNA
jgi:hypothetical protein